MKIIDLITKEQFENIEIKRESGINKIEITFDGIENYVRGSSINYPKLTFNYIGNKNEKKYYHNKRNNLLLEI